MDYSFIEIFGALYQVKFELMTIENGFWVSSLFYLEKHIPADSCVDLVINDKIRPTFICFYGEVEIYKLYSVSTYISSYEYIRDIVLNIKNANGLEVGSWKICENIINNYSIYQSFYYSFTFYFYFIFTNFISFLY
jgi:hypothetical protein